MLQQVDFVKSCHKSYVRLLEFTEDDYKHFFCSAIPNRSHSLVTENFTAGIYDKIPVKRHTLDHEHFLNYNITELKMYSVSVNS